MLVLFFVQTGFAQSGEKLWPESIYTARNVWYLDKLEQEIIHELNKVRTNPKQFAEEYLEELQAYFDGKVFTYPGRTPIMTKEGVAPLKECIEILKNTEGMSILYPSDGLSKASLLLTEDQRKNGGIGHISKNGTDPQNRIKRYGEWNLCLAENIVYGNFDARQIVISLLIDDGVPDRSHRINNLNPCFRYVGISFGAHPTYQSVCVMDFAGDYKTK
jgi:hypothetical protein